MRNYPLLELPDEVLNKSLRETTKKEAKIYFNWVLKNLDSRVSCILTFFEEKMEGNPVELLDRLGHKINKVIRSRKFSSIKDGSSEDSLKLTPEGYSLAFDMGLLITKLVLMDYGEKVKIHLVDEAKRDINYHDIVLTGLGTPDINPVSSSIVRAVCLLRKKCTSSVWKELYLHIKKRAES